MCCRITRLYLSVVLRKKYNNLVYQSPAPIQETAFKEDPLNIILEINKIVQKIRGQT
jgi:hypothetical protein